MPGSQVTSRVSQSARIALACLAVLACSISARGDEPEQAAPKVTVARVRSKAAAVTQEYVCQIHAQRHVKLRALEKGSVEAVAIKEGQAVKQGDLLFKIEPPSGETLLVKAPFDGLVGRLIVAEGELVEEGAALTTLSDNSQMTVYFNVPEARYLEFKAAKFDQHPEELQIDLMLANGRQFDQPGKFAGMDADFNNQTGNIPFLATFPNPDRLLRHGQTGRVQMSHVLPDSILIPQRATFEILTKRYVYVVDKASVVRQREVVVQDAAQDQFIVKSGLRVGEKIIVDGIRQVHDGEKVAYKAD